MGTRHLVCVVVDGQYKVAQYGQWDGYPSGQGVTALNFLREQFDREKFLARLAAAYEPDQGQIEKMNARLEAENAEVGALYPSMSRDTGAGILALIQDSTEPVPLRSAISFAADSLMCEWAYVIDLDKNTFEVFQGFNQEPLAEGERFYGWPEKFTGERINATYHPVRLLASFPLDALPAEDEFLARCEPSEEEEG